MKNLSYIAREINNGKELDNNLLMYLKSASSLYSTLGAIKLSMNFYTLVDILLEQDINDSFVSDFEKVRCIIEDSFKNGFKIENISTLEQIRQDFISTMEKVTNIVDRLRIYEYVLNRIEYKFKDSEFDYDYYNTYLTNEVMHYILADKDNVVINTKISEIIGQLPMRMSKGKFFDHIEDAFSLYHGATKSSIDDFYYSLSTTAMLKDLGDISCFKELATALDKLSNVKYGDVTKEEYEELKKAFDFASANINNIADGYVLLTQVLNDFLTISLLREYSLGNNEELTLATKIILDTCTAAITRTGMDSIAENFTEFEGKQEKLLENITSSDYIIDYVNKELTNELDDYLKAGYENLLKVTKLQSGSDFVSLFVDESAEEIPDNSYADDTAKKLIKELDESFKGMENLIKRAIESSVLSNLPVFFNDTKEIQDYINSSLISCSDLAEQKAVVEIIKSVVKG